MSTAAAPRPIPATRTGGVRHLSAAYEPGEDKLYGHVKPRTAAGSFPLWLIRSDWGAVSERLRVREIDDDEGQRLVRIIRRGSGSPRLLSSGAMVARRFRSAGGGPARRSRR